MFFSKTMCIPQNNNNYGNKRLPIELQVTTSQQPTIIDMKS